MLFSLNPRNEASRNNECDKKMVYCITNYFSDLCHTVKKNWPPAWYLHPATLTSVGQLCGLGYVLLRREPVWPSSALSAVHLAGLSASVGISAWVVFVEGREIGCFKSQLYSIIIGSSSFASFVTYTLLHPVNNWADHSLVCGAILGTGYALAALNMAVLVPVKRLLISKMNAIEKDTNVECSTFSNFDDPDKLTVFDQNEEYKSLRNKCYSVQVVKCVSQCMMFGCFCYQLKYLASRLRVF